MVIRAGTLYSLADSHMEKAAGMPGMVGPDHQHEALFVDVVLGEPITVVDPSSADENPVNADVRRQAHEADVVMRGSSSSPLPRRRASMW